MDRRWDAGDHKKTDESGVSRRQFLKRAGIAVGGTALVSMGLGEGCSPATTTTSEPPANTTSSTGTTTTTTNAVPPTSNPTASSTSLTTSSTTPTTPIATYNYIPPTAIPKLLTVGDTACSVADDGRLYSEEHVWVKTVSTGVVALGITETLVEMIAHPNQIRLAKLGDVLADGGNFGDTEGTKLSVDLIAPISGAVVQVNNFLLTFNTKEVLEPLMDSPYNDGWMVVVQMSKPDELKNLLSATQYRDLLSIK